MSPPPEDARDGPLVGLFVTCLVDLFRPSIAFAAIKLLEAGGVRVEVPRAQTCCGQPAYNSGNGEDAAAIARQVIEAFERFDYVVAPSGSCAGMLKVHYPRLLADDPASPSAPKLLAPRATSSRPSWWTYSASPNSMRLMRGPSLITTHVRPCASFTSRMRQGDS